MSVEREKFVKTDKIKLDAWKLLVLFSCVEVHVACCDVDK